MPRLTQIVAFLLCLNATQAFAEMTPNHVFQVTEHSIVLLERVNEANFSEPDYPTGEVVPALPRHVLQLARDVWRKTQLLRFMNGLPTYSLSPVPARNITPADVKETVDQIHEQLEGILPAYGIYEPPEEPPMPSGKSPTDVFANLLRMSAALDSLGVPATVPNDVHQIAETVLQDALRLAALTDTVGADTAAGSVTSVWGRSPKDAYGSAVLLLNDLAELSAADGNLSIKGGVGIPAEKDDVSPNDVIIVLLRARAELNAMRVAMNDSSASDNTRYEGGKTPSDVVTSVMRARAVIQSIKNSRSG